MIVYFLGREERLPLLEEAYPDSSLSFFDMKNPKALPQMTADKGLYHANKVIILMEEIEASEDFYISQIKTLRSHTRADLVVGIHDEKGAAIILGALGSGGIHQTFLFSETTNLLERLHDPTGSTAYEKPLLAEKVPAKILLLDPTSAPVVGRAAKLSAGIFEKVRDHVSPMLAPPKGAVLQVAVAGSQPRIGTTTQALGIYRYLKSVGLRPLYIDLGARLLKSLAPVDEEMEMLDNGALLYNDTELCPSFLPEGYNATVTDMGQLQSIASYNAFATADMAICVGGTKLPELALFAETHKKLELLREGHTMYLFSFTTEELFRELRDSFDNAACAKYNPDYWSGELATYRELLQEKLQEVLPNCTPYVLS